jgi:hypothetical protein
VLFQKTCVYRRKLWFTGHNVNNRINRAWKSYASTIPEISTVPSSQSKPKANEEQCTCGRMKDRGKACWWCGATNVAATEYIQCFCGATKKKGERCQSCGL